MQPRAKSTLNKMNDSKENFQIHHLIPRHAKYWSDLAEWKEDPLYKVKLTIEGHACQHDILWRVFRKKGDFVASRVLMGQVEALDVLNSRFEGYTHTDEWKENNSEMMKRLHSESPERREQTRQLGRGKHKRNPEPGCKASAEKGRAYMRQHWRKEVWEAVEDAWNNRTSFHWGKTSIAKTFGVSVRTIEHMLELIQKNVDWQTAVGGEF